MTRLRSGKRVIGGHFAALLLCVAFASASHAGDLFSSSGRLDLHGAHALRNDSVEEDPSLDARIKLDAAGAAWRFHAWLEGGWDGSVKRPAAGHAGFKNYDEVYQSNTPYLEFKELYVSFSTQALDLRAGIQRFAWGRIDEYPSNDLLNPWDYAKFPRQRLEDRKIGVPSLSASVTRGDWTMETVWIPVFVPYRLSRPDERWSGNSAATLRQIPDSEIRVREPDLPARTLENSAIGLRLKHLGDREWTVNLFHGYDPRPVFRSTALSIIPAGGAIEIDPGYVPDFHRITTIGVDAAFVTGSLSLRLEASYVFNRYLNVGHEFWGYPASPGPGTYPLNTIEQKHDAVDYGIGADYRLFEDGQLTMQAQQTVTRGNVDLLYERKIETILWANLKASFLNQKIETNVSAAWNPEHGDHMLKTDVWWVFSDAWKAGAAYAAFTGPVQSYFGRYSRNDQIEAELRYSW